MAPFPAGFREHAARLGLEEGLDPAAELGRHVELAGRELANRICALPMEGWDADEEGRPTARTLARWRAYGASGAALVWGEAAAVSSAGRAHGRQLLVSPANLEGLAGLVAECRRARRGRFGEAAERGMAVGLQLNHGGRFARPRPRPAWRDRWLDERTGIGAGVARVGDEELEAISRDFAAAAALSAEAGFDFVDVKLCHLYLGHELLCAREREGRYGGGPEGGTRFFLETVERIREKTPGLALACRLSLFEPSPAPAGTPGATIPFGADPADPWRPDPAEPERLAGRLLAAGINLLGTTLGSPYTTPHLVRPASAPAAGEARPPESPFAGAARHLELAGRLKAHHPGLVVVAPGFTPLREAAPETAAAAVAAGLVDLAGLGRGLLACPDWPARVLAGTPPPRHHAIGLCAGCTTRARQGHPATCILGSDHSNFF